MTLPISLTRLLGRDEEIVRARRLLVDEGVRLLTLTGPPGTGKARLAQELAVSLEGAFEDGVRFVPLAPVRDKALVIAAVARAVDIPEEQNRSLQESLQAFIGERQVLLVLDNFEQVLDAASDVVDLLAHCPHLHVLVTSRAPLRLRGEREFPVSPLALPERGAPPTPETLAQYAAVALFVERAQSVQPSFALDESNATAVAEICRRLDGLPLAIELAAVRVKILPPKALLAKLKHRLPLLTAGPRDLPVRHQRLRDAIAWSYDLLSPDNQALLRYVAIFAGGFSLEEAAAVAGQVEVIDGIASLVDHSLLRQGLGIDGAPRYYLLETIREYALDQLAVAGETGRAQRRHAAFFLVLAEEAAKHLHGSDQAQWLDRLEQDRHNLHAAIRWAVEAGEREVGLRLCVAVWWFWFVRAHFSEGRELLAAALALSPSAEETADIEALHAEALIAAGFLAEYHGSDTGAITFTERALAAARTLRDKQLTALALIGRAMIAVHRGPLTEACALLSEAVSTARSAPNERLTAWCVNTLGHIAYQERDYLTARRLLEEALEIRRKIGDEWGIATSLNDLGHVSFRMQDYADAQAHYEQSLTIRRRIGHKQGIALSLAGLGRVASMRGEHESAQSLWEESLSAASNIGNMTLSSKYMSSAFPSPAFPGILLRFALDACDRSDFVAARIALTQCAVVRRFSTPEWLFLTLAGFSYLAAKKARWERAARLAGATSTGTRPAEGGVYGQFHEQLVDPVREALAEGRPSVAQAWAEGEAMTLDEAVEYALSDNASEAAGVAEQSRSQTESTAAKKQPSADPLTPREREVAVLIAKGYTNRQIAQELIISERTAMRHVEHILGKLGVHSRAQVAAWAVEKGLIAATNPT